MTGTHYRDVTMCVCVCVCIFCIFIGRINFSIGKYMFQSSTLKLVSGSKLDFIGTLGVQKPGIFTK